MIFTIENDTNNIAVHPTAKEAKKVPDADVFQTEATLAKLAAKWPAERLVAILISLPGEKPVKKLADRKKAVARIWKSVQSLLGASGAPQTPPVAPKRAPAKKSADRTKGAHTAATKGKVSRAGSKTEKVLELLKRAGGVTAKELIKATDWQPHSVRGFLSGTVGKKMGLTVVSTKGEDGERTYSIEA